MGSVMNLVFSSLSLAREKISFAARSLVSSKSHRLRRKMIEAASSLN